MIRVVLADDHRILREGLKLLLAGNAELVLEGEAGDGVEALRLITELRPDVAILDQSMPGLKGIDVIEQVVAAELPTRCILLTMENQISTVRRALQAGAQGYVLKECAYGQLVAAIVAVNDGQRFLGAFDEDPRLSTEDKTALTKREKEVLRAVLRGESSRQIADVLCISVRTVETHRQKIMSKLGVHNSMSLARYAREHNLV